MFEFSRSCRLVSKYDFQSVFAKAQKITHKRMIVLYKNNQQAGARLGIIISKNNVKLAVNRNRLRRVMRESFRHHKEGLKGLDIVVLMRTECTPQGTVALRDDIDHLWLKLANSPKPV